LSSRAEEITSEVRRLVSMYRNAESQLAQSIPKKDHELTVTKLQERISQLETDLNRTKAELEKTKGLGERIDSLSQNILSQSDKMVSQEKMIELAVAKFAENSVPSKIYEASVTRIQEMERKIAMMIEREHFDALDKRYNEAQQRIAAMVPREEFALIEARLASSVPKSQYDELLQTFERTTVPVAKYEAAEKRIAELEARLGEMVPRTDYEALMGSIVTLTREATVEPEVGISTSQPAAQVLTLSHVEETPAPAASSTPEPVLAASQ